MRWQDCVGGGEDGRKMKQLSSLGRVEEEGRRAAKGWRWAGEHTRYLIQLTTYGRNKCAAGLWIQQRITPLTLLFIQAQNATSSAYLRYNQRFRTVTS